MSSFFHKGIISILVSIFIVSGILYASPPTPPDGKPAGGLFSIYFKNIIGGNLGTGTCPPGQVIIGFNTGTSWNLYGVPICQIVASDTTALSGAIQTLFGNLSSLSGTVDTLSGRISSIIPNQWINYPNNTTPTGIYYPVGNIGIGVMPIDGTKKLSVLGNSTFSGNISVSGSIQVSNLPISPNDVVTKSYVDAAILSSGGGGVKVYQQDGVTAIGYFLGYEGLDPGNPKSLCERMIYSSITGLSPQVAGIGGCYFQNHQLNQIYFPNTNCSGNQVYSQWAMSPEYKFTTRDSQGRYLIPISGSYVIHNGTQNWSQWNFSTNQCVQASITYTNYGNYANSTTYYLTPALCGNGNCLIKP